MEANGLVIGKRDITGVSVYSIPGLRRDTLQVKVERMWGLGENTLFSRTRKTEYVMARHMYVALCYEHVRRSLSGLARLLPGGFDHATIYHSIRTCRDLCETDKGFRAKYLEAETGIINGWLTGPKI